MHHNKGDDDYVGIARGIATKKVIWSYVDSRIWDEIFSNKKHRELSLSFYEVARNENMQSLTVDSKVIGGRKVCSGLMEKKAG